MPADTYMLEVLRAAPRLLSLMDRSPLSKTFGCFDRQYWHYTAIDFPCARSQEAALTLALLYKTPHPKNPYYDNAMVLEWANAALDFWARIQDSNGSFSEWYPHENSFVATVFSSYAVSEALIQLGDSARDRDALIDSLKRSAAYFTSMDEGRAVNQETGAIAALCNLSILTGEKRYLDAASQKMSFIQKNQTEEGWFPEYGGADIGYLSLAIDYLAKYQRKSRDDLALPVLEKAVSFIKYFIHPDSTFGGEYASRNTSYLIPDGFEILSPVSRAAASIACKIRESLEKRSSVWLASIDDRYLSYITYTYLQAYSDARDLGSKQEALPCEKEASKVFPLAGFWIYGDGSIYVIANQKKGGTFKAFFKQSGDSFTDCGITAETSSGARLVSSWLTDSCQPQASENSAESSGVMRLMPGKYLTPAKSLILRSFQMTAGRNAFIGRKVKDKLRDHLITKTGGADITFERRITVKDGSLCIVDRVSPVKDIRKLIIGGSASHIYTPSSRYFQGSDLATEPLVLEKKDFFRHAKDGSLRIERSLDLKGIMVECRMGAGDGS